MSGRRHLILLALLVIVGGFAASLPEGSVSGSSRPALPEQVTVVPTPPDFNPAPYREPPPAVGPLVTRLNDEGMVLYEAGELSEALVKFEQALAWNRADRIVRRNLALTKTRLAWRQVEAGKYDEAVRAFKEAEAIQPGEGGILLGLGVTHHFRGEDGQAKTLLLRALDADANLVIAHKLLGEIAYGDDELDIAAAHFEAVLRLDPADVVVRERLDRVRNEAQAQAGFQRLEGRHFTVKFGGRADPAFARDILGRLEAAYQDVGRWLGPFPDRTVPVILYAEEEFHDVTVTPAWAQGVFDGKIRLPVGGASVQAELLNKVIRHEYTHALVHARTRGHVPTWLTEGLAIVFEGNDVRRGWDLLRKADHLVPLRELHGSFLTLPPSQRSLAYAESFAAVQYLIDRHGVRPVRTLLKDLGGSKDFDRTFQEALGLPYPDFQAAFIRGVSGCAVAPFHCD